MTAPFTYPTSDYSSTSPAQAEVTRTGQRVMLLEASLKNATARAKRSPKKWASVVEEITADLAVANEAFEAAKSVTEAEYAARREARRQLFVDAVTWALAKVGPVEMLEGTVPALRVRDADGGDDILVYSQGSLRLEGAFVKKGTNEITDRFGSITGPDEKWSRVSEPVTIAKSTLGTWSSSNMTPEEALSFAGAIRILALVASNLDEAFGL
jgi:hypothetical protein